MVNKEKHLAQSSGRYVSGRSNEKDAVNNVQQRITAVRRYLHTPEGLWRLLACFPPTMSVVEALQQAPSVLSNCRKEVAL